MVIGDSDKCIKTKINSYGDKVNTNFQDRIIPKENTLCKCFFTDNARFCYLNK